MIRYSYTLLEFKRPEVVNWHYCPAVKVEGEKTSAVELLQQLSYNSQLEGIAIVNLEIEELK